jgi:type IV secretory pathway VirB10-like protein
MWWKWWERPSSRTDASSEPGRVIDHRITPPGVMPRHLQQWMVIGVVVVMVGIMALTPGSPTTPRTPELQSGLASVVVNPSQQRIEEYERRIQEQAQRLAAEQARLELTRAAVDAPASTGASTALVRQPEPAFSPVVGATPDSRSSGAEPMRVADNVAYSKLTSAGPQQLSPAPQQLSPAPQQLRPALPAPTIFEPAAFPSSPVSPLPATAAALPAPPPSLPPTLSAPPNQSLPFPTVPASNVSALRLPATAVASDLRAGQMPLTATAAHHQPASTFAGSVNAVEPRYRVFEGTFIDTVLTNRLDGTFTGPVNCLVSAPVYASDFQHVVIPAGARVLGEARAVNTFGQSRLAVTFHRILMPNGDRVDLNDFHGLNQVGDLGLQDQVNRHYAQIFGASLAIGAIAGLAQAQTGVGFGATATDVYRQGMAANLSESSARILDRFLNLLPTVTIREGHRIKIYLANDLELPAYREPLATGGR